MKTKKNVFLRFPIIFSFILPFASMVVASLVSVLIFKLFPSSTAGLFDNPKMDLATCSFSISEILVAAFYVFCFHKIGRKEWVFGFQARELWKGIFIFGWPMLLFGFENISDALIFLEGHLEGSAFGVLVAFLVAFAAGFFEEIIFRGIIMNNFLYQWRDKKKVILLATIFSSISFGALHMTNILQAPVVDTITQVIYAGGVGIGFAALYLRTGNLWSAVIVHTFVDFLSFVFIKQLEGVVFTRIESLTTAGVAIVWGLYSIRTIKEANIKKNFSWIFAGNSAEQ